MIPRSKSLNIGALLLFSVLQIPGVDAVPAVDVTLKAAFDSPPFLVELLETAADENSTSYFPILDRIADGYFDKSTTDEELYRSFSELVQNEGYLADPETFSSFELALSIHAAAPRIEAHYQFYETSAEPSLESPSVAGCEIWVQLDGKQYCSPELGQPAGSLSSASTYDLPFDRIFGDSTSPTKSVLYADITSSQFRRFHKTISSTANQGKSSYRLRYKPSSSHKKEPLVVSGYGVELALKRTDYIVIDDRKAEKERDEDVEKGVGASLDTEDVADLKPLAASEVITLGAKAGSFVMNSDNPLDTLVKLLQDFPKHSSAIAASDLSSDFWLEHMNNRETFLPSGYNLVWINGLQVQAREMNAFSLLPMLRRERGLINGIGELGFTPPEAIKILSHPTVLEAHASDDPQRYDYRDEIEGGNVIIWLNNIEKDKRYKDWPDDIIALLQRMFPGQLPSIRKDIHNVIVPVDLSSAKDVTLVVESLQSIIKRKVPIQFGIVPSVRSQAAKDQAKLAYHLLDTYGLAGLMTYLETALDKSSLSTPSPKHFDLVLKGRKLRSDQTAQGFQEVLTGDSLHGRLQSAKNYLIRLAANEPTPPMFVNGIAIRMNEDWTQAMSSRISTDLRDIQIKVYQGELDEDSWLAGLFLVNATSRRNSLVIPEDEKNITLIDPRTTYVAHQGLFDNLPRVDPDENAAKRDWAHLMVIADFTSDSGIGLLSEAIVFRRTNEHVQLVLLHNENEITTDNRSRSFDQGDSGKVPPLGLSELEQIAQKSQQILNGGSVEDAEYIASFWNAAIAKPIVESLNMLNGQTGLLLNGRLIAPIPVSSKFVQEDLAVMLAYESKKRFVSVAAAVNNLDLEDKIETPLDGAKLSSFVARSMVSDVPEGIFESSPGLRISMFDKWDAEHTMIAAGDKERAVIQLVAVVDPASELAQRWAPIIKVLSELSGVYTRIFLNPKDQMEELPIKRFYRQVLKSKPVFTDDGSLQGLTARFSGLPAEALLTMAMDAPPSWLIAAKDSIQDLDNIKLSSIKSQGDVEATYELENILIEGHTRDMSSGAPPRGAQLVLGTDKDPNSAGTIIMANIGYFQFKANPGFYRISLQKGRSEEIFQIDSAGPAGWTPAPGDETTDISLISFQGTTLYPRLSRKPGMEEEDVLEPSKSKLVDLAETGAEFADSLLSQVGLSGLKSGLSKAQKLGSDMMSQAGLSPQIVSPHADINIFSVASGHLYERMLNIMMVSVMRHTNHTVKFWFIEQFLSPSFKSFLPILAAEYGFDFEMVTYKWPHWLRGQKEKQREIWGYKILFLDVLFPLDLDKVIFVDADQIVRTDMFDLVSHDLEGKPYGFTPMCDSRTEMEGFRFWKQGYWKNFLRGLPYHISALYVVDLKKFRQIAAGDRLRQQYHQLSADPNSLSNLDQDLPNHMQVVLPIHSLSQEWLWCETWCSDESLKEARTIDLCNNPQTKEPKLDRARRQVPEWTVYDEEIATLAKRKRGGEGAAKVVEAEAVAGAYGAGVEGEKTEETERTNAIEADKKGESKSHTVDEL
ncbi:MAG: hypothetical protein M1822_008282 [Bathelium mastoideum]|nr:MAG: hypothetical protein M1822_008282 [Bathelium mastoideum]